MSLDVQEKNRRRKKQHQKKDRNPHVYVLGVDVLYKVPDSRKGVGAVDVGPDGVGHVVRHHLQRFAQAVELFVRPRRVVRQMHHWKGRRFTKHVNPPADTLVPFGADGVELLLVLQHFFGGVGNLKELRHQPTLGHRTVPLVAQRSSPRPFATLAFVARPIWKSTVLAVERAFFDLAVVTGVVRVARTGDVVERLPALAVSGTTAGSVGAERCFAVVAQPSCPTRARSADACAVVAIYGVTSQCAGAGTTTTGRGSSG